MDFSYAIMTTLVWVLDTFYSFVGSYGIGTESRRLAGFADDC